MPNHVKNIVKMDGIVGLPLFSTTDRGEKCFDFNTIKKMPKSLEIESGSMTDECIIYALSECCTIPVEEFDEKRMELARKLVKNLLVDRDGWIKEVYRRVEEKTKELTEEERTEMLKKGNTYIINYVGYGHTTWFDWCCKNWGTKWNAYSFEEEGEDTISFLTAWSNPEPIMLKLSEMYPETEIEHWWADEDMGSNTGHRTYLAGEIIYGDYHDSCSNEAYETYNECWGESPCLYQDEDNNWQRRDCENCHGCD